MSVGWRCPGSFASPSRLQYRLGAIWARKASGIVILTKHRQVSVYRSLPHFMPRKFKTPLLHFSDLGMRFLDQTWCFLHCSVRTPAFGHFGHVQGQAHVGLFQLYTTSSPCHRCRRVEYVQGIRCCFKQEDSAMTSTIYASVACFRVINGCFVHSCVCFSRKSSANILELTIS